MSAKIAIADPLFQFEYGVIQFDDDGRLDVDVFQKSLLAAYRFALSLGHNGAVVDATCKVVIYVACFSKHLGEVLSRYFAQMAAGEDAHLVHSFRGFRPNAPKLFNGQRSNEVQSLVWMDHE